MSNFDVSALFSTNDAARHTVHACGMTFDVYVRRLPAVDLRKFYAEVSSDDDDKRATAGFNALVKSMRTEDGGAPFATFEQYRKMDADAITALMKVFTEVNAKRDSGDLGNA